MEGGDFAWGQGSEEPGEKEPAVELEPLEQSLGLPAVGRHGHLLPRARAPLRRPLAPWLFRLRV